MSSQTLEEIQAKRLEFLKVLKPIKPTGTDAIPDEDPKMGVLAELPPPPTPEDVEEIRRLWAESSEHVEAAKLRLESPATRPIIVNWELTLYQLFTAWIVNFGRDPEAEKARAAAQAGDMAKAMEHLKQNQQFIHDAAAHIGLEWIHFVDLALVAFNPEADYPASGPFGGVFVHRGEKPFMVLSFKGTTYGKEVNTDLKAFTVEPRDDILGKHRVHAGMYQGLFEVFPEMEKDAFEIIWENLEKVAKDLKGSSDRTIPVYVTGHSLGAGYASLAFVELMRRLKETPSSNYAVYDLWIYGAPRVGLNSFAIYTRDMIRETNRHIFRPTRYRDIVPTIPTVVFVGLILTTYKHFNGGLKMDPDSTLPFWSARLSEINLPNTFNDPDAEWTYHWPPMYYKAVRKILHPTEASE